MNMIKLFNKKKRNDFSSQPDVVNRKTLHKNLDFLAVEEYKRIRANLDFILADDEKFPVIGVTSSLRGEGKSTTSINLSYVLAEKGNKVLLIDGDLRIPSVAKKLRISDDFGLADLLKSKGAQTFEFQSHILENWYVLPSGTIPPNPSELLGSKRMANILSKLREMFDYIIIDLPPVNLVSDVISISNLISGVLLVIREGYTEKKEVESCFRQLKMSDVNILGCVINDSSTGAAANKKNGYYK